MKKESLAGVSEFGAFDASNEWSVWSFTLFPAMMGKTMDTLGPIPDPVHVFVLAKLWMDAKPLAEVFLTKGQSIKGKLSWGEVTNGSTTFAEGSRFIFKGPRGDLEEVTLPRAADRKAVIGLARRRIGQLLVEKVGRRYSKVPSGVQVDRKKIVRPKAKRVAKNRSRGA